MDQKQIEYYKACGMSDSEIEKRIEQIKKLREWEEKTLSKKPKFEKVAKLGPILSVIGFCMIIATVVLTGIPPIEEFVRGHLIFFAIWLGSNLFISTIGFILDQIDLHNELYRSLIKINEEHKKWKEQLKEN